MINRNDFMKQMKRLTETFSDISEIALEEYYDKFKVFELSEIEEAISMLIIEHKGDFTPKPKEILGMINEIRRQSSSSYPSEHPLAPQCEVCEGTGFKTWLEEGRLKATPCVKCKRGKVIIDAPKIKTKSLNYPDGWRELYNLRIWGKTIKEER